MKKIQFMDTSFRDGFQSCYGARVATRDFLPAVEAALHAGTTHFEAGGGARFQSLFFYCNESAFDMMDSFRAVTGNDANLQTLARGINVVALSQQPRDIIDLHAKLFKKHGITTIRNFCALNDVRNLKYSSQRIVANGLKHQIVVTMMDLPPGCTGAHTAEFYLQCIRNIIDEQVPFDSLCFKDASGTSNPRKIYDTVKGARKLLGDDVTLWFHTHDTAGIGITQYIAAIQGGIDGIDLCMAPVSGGTCQPDILSMWHALKGTEYSIDIDYEKILKAEEVFTECMKDYFVPPEAKMVSPNIPLSPMPGGALTANTMMMRDTQTLHLYPKVILEMSEVVKRGGFGTSVTPVSQFYFQQAYTNVTQGPWKKIQPNYGDMVLGYYGRTPVEPDPDIVKLASAQMGKPVFTDDPLDILEPGIPKATKILEEHGLTASEENIFILASCETKGLDYLLGRAKTSIRKISKENPGTLETAPVKPKSQNGNRHYTVNVDGRAYQVIVSQGGDISAQPAGIPKQQASLDSVEVNAPTPGNILQILATVGDVVKKDETLLVLEAMKMETAITAPSEGRISSIEVSQGDTVQAGDLLVLLN